MEIPLEGAFRVLLVSEDPSPFKPSLFRLKAAGFDWAETTDAVEALSSLNEEFRDILVLEHPLAGEDEERFFRAVRRLPQGSTIPVLVFSGDSNAETVNRFVRLGIVGYMLKPLNPSRFEESLQALAPRCQARRTHLYLDDFFEKFRDDSVEEEQRKKMVRDIYHSRFFGDFLNNPSALEGRDGAALLRIVRQFFKGVDRMLLERVDASDEDRALESLRVIEGFLSEAPDADATIPLSRLIAQADEKAASKAAKLLGRVTDDIFLLRRFLLNRNSRFVANLLESLWASERDDVNALFRAFLGSLSPRIRANCIIGLWNRGEKLFAYETLLKTLSMEHDPAMLRSGVWAACRMGLAGYAYPAEWGLDPDAFVKASRELRSRLEEGGPEAGPAGSGPVSSPPVCG